MLNVYVGRFEASDGDIDAIFAGQYEEEWFTDDYVKTLVKIFFRTKENPRENRGLY